MLDYFGHFNIFSKIIILTKYMKKVTSFRGEI